MKKKSTMFFLLAAVLASAGYSYFWHEDPAMMPPTISQYLWDEVDKTPFAKTKSPPPNRIALADFGIASTPVDWVAMYSSYNGQNPMIDRNNKRVFSASEVAAYDALHVIPYNQWIGETCPLNPEDECVPIYERPPSGYFNWPLDELAEFAEHDPEGAVVMIQRVRKWTDKLEWAGKAVKLSGKPGAYALIAGWYPTTFDVGSMEWRLNLEKFAHKAGDPRAQVEFYEGMLEKCKEFYASGEWKKYLPEGDHRLAEGWGDDNG